MNDTNNSLKIKQKVIVKDKGQLYEKKDTHCVVSPDNINGDIFHYNEILDIENKKPMDLVEIILTGHIIEDLGIEYRIAINGDESDDIIVPYDIVQFVSDYEF